METFSTALAKDHLSISKRCALIKIVSAVFGDQNCIVMYFPHLPLPISFSSTLLSTSQHMTVPLASGGCSEQLGSLCGIEMKIDFRGPNIYVRI